MIRRHIVFRGMVQAVGFRYRARLAAEENGCTGFVRNEWDGSVTMEIQGTEKAIAHVIVSIEQGRFICIDRMEAETIPIIEGEHGFKTY